MESKESGILERISKGQVDLVDALSVPTKNKLINVAGYLLNRSIGNKELAINILSNLKLEDIYLNVRLRRHVARNMSKVLSTIKDAKQGNQCRELLTRYINIVKILGSGSFGEVSICSLVDKSSIYGRFPFALKMAKIMKGTTDENHIAKLINRLVLNSIAQNLPILFDTYYCNKCNFKSKTIVGKVSKCTFSISEIATAGDMVGWLRTNPPENELDSAIFQIMAGLHALQYHYGIMNNDIKAENILIYNVNRGGYWKYTIYGRDFYVPNYGKLFVVNDFGVSQIFFPQFKEQKEIAREDLGTRLFVIRDDRLEPLNTPFIKAGKNQVQSAVIQWDQPPTTTYVNNTYFETKKKQLINIPVLNQSQKDFIIYDSNDLRFYGSSVVPPLEFMSDTQDAIRIFTGGKRMSQGFVHGRFEISPSFKSKLNDYAIPKEMSYIAFLMDKSTKSSNLSKILAGYFILDYFTSNTNYTRPVDRDLIISSIRTS